MRHWTPLLLAVLTLLGLAFYEFRISLQENAGQLIYGLDDAYIHMAIAKNFAEHGVWGVTRFGFSSSSSSILWTLVLGLIYKVIGVSIYLPFILNVLCGVLALLVADLMLRGPLPHGFYRFLVLVLLMFITPFAPLLTSGMEHLMQVMVVLAFAGWSARAIANDDPRPMAGTAPLMFLSSLFVAFVRYETAFLALVVCILLFVRRRWFQAIALGLLVLVPIVIYGWISHAHGWYPLPNSVLLKSGVFQGGAGSSITQIFSMSGVSEFLGNPVHRAMDVPHLFFLGLLALVLYVLEARDGSNMWSDRCVLILIFVASLFLHLQFADVGWFFRYEAYLMALGVVGCAAMWAGHAPRLALAMKGKNAAYPFALGLSVLSILFVFPSLDRGFDAWVKAPQAMNDRYFEHVIPSQFVQEYYANDVVMANDIGALCFLTDARILDIYGLGSLEPAQFREGPGGYAKEDLKQWSREEGARIAIVQLGWGEITERLPDDWILVGVWDVPRNVVFGDTEVGWYATSEAEAELLMKNLSEFAPKVPFDIVQKGPYMGETGEDLIKPYPAAAPKSGSRSGRF